jgi:hypothetical protein
VRPGVHVRRLVAGRQPARAIHPGFTGDTHMDKTRRRMRLAHFNLRIAIRALARSQARMARLLAAQGVQS